MSSRATLHVLYPDEFENLIIVGNMILIQVDDREEVTESGLVLQAPEEAEKRGACRGIVVNYGPLAGLDRGYKGREHGLQKGNIAMFPRYEGEYVAVIGETTRYIIMPDSEVMCYINKQESTHVREDRPAD